MNLLESVLDYMLQTEVVVMALAHFRGEPLERGAGHG